MVKGLVSLIVPTYNRIALLPETLASARNQTYRNIEIIVVDDGSTDGTPDFLRADPQRVPGEKLLVQARRGVSVARNLGLSAARGEHVLFLDSDDLLETDAVQTMLDTLDRQGADYVHAPLVRVGGGLQPLSLPHFMAGPKRFDYQWGTHGALFRRDIFFAAGGYHPGLRSAEDTELTWRIRSLGRREAFHPRPVGRYRQHNLDHLDSYPTDMARYLNYWQAMRFYLTWLVQSPYDSPLARRQAAQHCLFIVARLAECRARAAVREACQTIVWLRPDSRLLKLSLRTAALLPRPDLAVQWLRALRPAGAYVRP